MTLKGWIAVCLIVGTPWAAPAQTFDHGAFDALLKAHVADGLVDYDAFAKAPSFPRYLSSLAAFSPASLPRAEQLAFWINAYNAYTIQLINQHGERQSIRNINRTFGFVRGYGPWTEKLATVGGKAYGLDEIEQDIIRPTYQEPRIHFALVCAAMGCPPLRSEAYAGASLEAQLEDQGRLFVTTQPAKNRVDVASHTCGPSEPDFSQLPRLHQGFRRHCGRRVRSLHRPLLRRRPREDVATRWPVSLPRKQSTTGR